jgi:ribosome-associated protein
VAVGPATKTTTKKTGKAKAKRKANRAHGRSKSKSATEIAASALEDLKAQDIRSLDVRHLTSMTDTMIIASGRSDRHVRALAEALVERCKSAGIVPIGVEGQDSGEWVLVDLADVVVHVMLPRAREFYNIEKLWDIAARDAAAGS